MLDQTYTDDWKHQWECLFNMLFNFLSAVNAFHLSIFDFIFSPISSNVVV